MGNQSEFIQNNHKEIRSHINIFFVITAVSIVVIGIVTYSFQLGYKMVEKISPLVDATMEIKLEVTIAHLWFEEIVSGDRNEKIEDVIKHIDNAMWYATAMLEGGENPEGIYVPLVNPILRNDIEEVVKQIGTLKKSTLERYATIATAGAGTPMDQRYDDIFCNFLEQVDFVETKLQNSIASDLNQYRTLQFLLFVFLASSMFFLLYAFYRYEKQRVKNLTLIREAYSEIKVLSGFLPICASCKKIRDDNGYWNQIESYIKEHSEAEFSHGICPDCAKRLYPEVASQNSDPLI